LRAVAVGGVLALLATGCGETSREHAELDGGGRAGTAGASASGGAGTSMATGGIGGGLAAGGGRAVDKVDIGACRFEDPGVELLARFQILQADEADGVVDGSAGPEDVKRLDVSQALGALGGIECLHNLEELSLSVYGPEAPPVAFLPLAGLSRLRSLHLSGPFILDGSFGGLALEELQLRDVALANLEEVGKEAELRDLWLVQVPLTSLSGIEALSQLTTLRIEDAEISSLSPLERTSRLEKLELTALPSLTSLAGIEPHGGLRSLLTSNVPLTSLLPLARAEALESLNVWSSSLTSLEGLEGNPALTNVTVTNAALKDLTALFGLPQLSYVDVRDNLIEDLTPLTSCSLLSHLDVSRNAIRSLAPVAAMTSLQSLDASANSLLAIDVDLPPSLKTLWLASNAISSLAPLAAHPLETLSVSSNPLDSFAPLAELRSLNNLYADEVGATTLEAFPLARLRSLSLQNNRITNVAPLSGLGDLSVDLSGNDIAHLPADFVGPAAVCGGLVLVDNPLDTAARERLTLLCVQGGTSYEWDGGSCNKCPII
jgi:hypothetical protein